MTATLSPPMFLQFFDPNNSGAPAAGFKLFTYIAGTSTKQATWTDSTQTTQNGNPIILDSNGAAYVWLDPTLLYKFVFTLPNDTDPPSSPLRSVDNISPPVSAAILTQTFLGQILYPRTPAEVLAGVIPTNYGYETTPYDIRRYGASKGASNTVNKAALQTAISVVSAEGSSSGGVVIVPPNISYGYNVTDLTTFPSFSGCLAPCLVLDYGPGNSFAGFPTAYDGAQIRQFYFTPQTTATATFTTSLSIGATSATLTANWTLSTGPWITTFSNGDVRYVTFTNGATTATWTGGLSSSATSSATYSGTGQHQGNTLVLRNDWNTGVWLINDANLPAPGSPTRTALDNRRCQISWGNDGTETWKLTQGTLVGANLTNEELSNFALQKVTVAGDTIGDFVPFVWQRKTGNASFGSGGNVPVTSYDFYSVSAGFDQALFENHWDVNSRIYLRPSGGSTTDSYWNNNSSTGTQALGFRATGDALLIDRTSRVITTAAAFRRPVVPVSYSASITFNASAGYVFSISATNGTAFTINAPTGAVTGMTMSVEIKNASGGALGAVTWNAVFKMAAWTAPANTFARVITFYFDNINWREISRSADIPN